MECGKRPSALTGDDDFEKRQKELMLQFILRYTGRSKSRVVSKSFLLI
jgi:hypothetical protein